MGIPIIFINSNYVIGDRQTPLKSTFLDEAYTKLKVYRALPRANSI